MRSTKKLATNAVTHDAHFVEGRLPVEQHNVVVDQMPFDQVSNLQIARNFLAFAVLEEALEAGADALNKVGSRMDCNAINTFDYGSKARHVPSGPLQTSVRINSRLCSKTCDALVTI